MELPTEYTEHTEPRGTGAKKYLGRTSTNPGFDLPIGKIKALFFFRTLRLRVVALNLGGQAPAHRPRNELSAR